VLRTLKYVRYLDDCGWRVTLIAPTTDAYSIVDPRLEKQLPSSLRVVRTRWLNTKRHFALFGAYPSILAVPDVWLGWLPWGVAAGRHVVNNDRPDVIYSTSPFATAHLIAFRLARVSRLPWVADFRDPWFEDTPEPGAPAGRLYRRIDRFLERSVVERCAHVVTSTTQLAEHLRKRYPYLPREKITTIENGYDDADFQGISTSGERRRERFAIVHAGSINAEFRDPRPLFRALGRAIDKGKVDRHRVEVRFLGSGAYGQSEAIRAELAMTGLQEQIEFTARLPYDETLRQIGRADLLLLLQASADTVALVPAKLYEYLRARKPVLALVYPGATSEVLSATGGGWAVDPRDEAALEDTIVRAYRAWVDGSLEAHAATLDSLRRFDRAELTKRLAHLFELLRRSNEQSSLSAA
jgi:glycosyltransferase involved in cell wall biosynthesis